MAIEAMKIYLDNCALQRPLDDKSQMRIRFIFVHVMIDFCGVQRQSTI
jgi:hypothetical protein